MNEPTAFNALCDLWTSHFNIMLTCVTILAGLFGLGGPLMFSMFQRQNLKDERERLNKEMAEKFAELDKQRELIAQHDLRINKLQGLTNGAYIALANYYFEELLRFATKLNDPTMTDDQKQSDMQRALICFGDALHCLVNSKNREWLVRIMNLSADPISKIIMQDQELLKKAADVLRQNNPRNNFFVTREKLAEIVGPENSVYRKFVSKFQLLFELVEEFYGA